MVVTGAVLGRPLESVGRGGQSWQMEEPLLRMSQRPEGFSQEPWREGSPGALPQGWALCPATEPKGGGAGHRPWGSVSSQDTCQPGAILARPLDSEAPFHCCSTLGTCSPASVCPTVQWEDPSL